MALVKMLKTAAGPNGTFIVGQTVELDDDTALAFADAGAAQLLSTPTPRTKVVERAVVMPPESAVATPQRRGPPARTRTAISPPRAPDPIGE